MNKEQMKEIAQILGWDPQELGVRQDIENLLAEFAKRVACGHESVTTPDGTYYRYGNPE